MDPSEVYLFNAQISRIVAQSIGFICCLVVLYYELKHRRTLSTNDKTKRQWLLLWAMLTILSSTANQIINVTEALPSTVFDICRYTTHLTLFLWFSKLIFLGLFQIRRLQYLFPNKADSNVRLSLMFKLLYGGAVMYFAVGILFLFVITVNDYHKYGCQWTYGGFGSVVNWIWIFVYLFWDASTLIVYIVKLSEFRSTVSINNIAVSNPETVALYNRITSILSKIILLTLTYEATTGITAILAFIVQLTQNEYVVIAFYAVGAIDVFIVGFVVYLMQKHNEKHYFLFLFLLDKLYLTFFCKRLSSDARANIDSEKEKTTTVKNKTEI